MAKKITLTRRVMLAMEMVKAVAREMYGHNAHLLQAEIALEDENRELGLCRITISALVLRGENRKTKNVFQCLIHVGGDCPPSPREVSVGGKIYKIPLIHNRYYANDVRINPEP